MIDILFIGSNPSTSSETSMPFEEGTKSRKTINAWLIQLSLNQHNVYFYNVSDEKTINNKQLSKKTIIESAPYLRKKIDMHKKYVIISLGKTASIALKLSNYEFYSMPHPSGANRLLNDKLFMENKLKELNEFIIKSIS